MLDLSRLSPEQRRAVLAGDGPLLIVAGPGSGKTTVLAARIAYLVTSRAIAPSSVLAVTFATKSARELRARLGGMLGKLGLAVEVCTFHAFGLRILRLWSEELGLGPGPLAVYGKGEALKLLREAADQIDFDLEGRPLPDLARSVDRLRLGDDTQPREAKELQPLLDVYEELLRRRGAVDYPAMLALPLRLFSARPAALRLYQDSYRYVVSDEFQDVCAAQYALLRSLAECHHNLVVVGDPRQTLYGWRGADVRFLRDFERDFPEAQVLSLDQNFRSTGRIVDLANALGESLEYSQPLWTDNPEGEVALLHVAQDEQAEAAFVAVEIQRLLEEQRIDHPGEVAVLYRTNQQAHELILALKAERLPYRVLGRGDLFALREVRDVIAYLRLAHDPADGAALARIANVPPRRLGRVAERLRDRPLAPEEFLPLAQSYGSTAASSASSLLALIEELHRRSLELAPAEILDLVLERSGYATWLADQPDGSTRLAHVATLRALAEQAEGDLGAWLADLQLGEEVAPAPDDARKVLLTTIHGAKGGEWRVVFVVGVEEGLLPHPRALLLRETESSGLREELRVAYVAVTRPRERLYLTCCRTRRLGERAELRRPSRFFRGLPSHLIERAA